ncbi:MAG: hypothetical protein JJ899_10795, partial [Alphaproteobacteria bacterium]|nr:hypothetical protein [Alphaproteobacteria bacterium]
MKLATLDTGGMGHAAALTEDGELIDLVASELANDVPESVQRILGNDAAMGAVARALEALDGLSDGAKEDLRAAGELVKLEDADLLAPVPRPNMILSVGLNYHRHIG